MTRWVHVALGLVVFAGGACASPAGTETGEEPTLSSAAVDLATASGGYPDRARVLRAAEEQLVEQCMRDRGQVYWPVVPALLPGSDEERIVDLPTRQAEGYGLASDDRPPSVGPSEGQPEFQRALFGDDQRHEELSLPNGTILSYPTSGCVADARAAIFGDNRSWARVDAIPQLVNNTLRERVQESAELADVTSQWSACMAEAGYHYASPEAAVADLVGRVEPGHEIAVATADGECQLKVHLPSVDVALRRAAAQSLPSTIRSEIAELTAIHCAAYRNAAAIVSVEALACD